MLGFSIMMWFVSLVIFLVSISLLRGNISMIHGKVFDSTKDKEGYGKALGRAALFMSIGIFISGIVALFDSNAVAIRNTLIVLLITIAVSGIWFGMIQKRYRAYR